MNNLRAYFLLFIPSIYRSYFTFFSLSASYINIFVVITASLSCHFFPLFLPPSLIQPLDHPILPPSLPFLSFSIPLFLQTYFSKAVSNDTFFLSIISVIDYSILVGFDEESHEIIVGIIDYMRQVIPLRVSHAYALTDGGLYCDGRIKWFLINMGPPY